MSAREKSALGARCRDERQHPNPRRRRCDVRHGVLDYWPYPSGLDLLCVQVRMNLKWLFEVIGIAAVICVLILFAAYGLLKLVEGI